MGNISTSNQNTIYKYFANIQSAFDNDDDPVVIPNLRFNSLVIDYNYADFAFPLIYATVSVTEEMVRKLQEHQKFGTVIFTLQKYISNSDMPGLKIDVANKQCAYFISNEVAKNKEEGKDPDRGDDYGYIVTIGLIALDHLNGNKINVNSTISGTKSAIVNYILKGHNVLMKPFQHNDKFTNLILPPFNSVSKAIKYINNLSVYYDEGYRFFMDFDTTYLLEDTPTGIPKKGELINSIKMIAHNTYTESTMEGMYEDRENKLYVIDISGHYVTIGTNPINSKAYDSVKGTTSTGTSEVTKKEDLSSTRDIKSNQINIRVPNGNTNLVKDYGDIKDSIITITKDKLDNSIFTINKVYYFDGSDVYGTTYDGYYTLYAKKEIYAHEGEGLASTAILTFTKRTITV